ncbi:MAG: glutathione S-transferase [Hyphomonas sp.]|nr:glutathione S-transferase [Hyphomonas sp.]
MADARSIILHEYPASPYSEKIRLALRLKNLAWSRVEIPVIMPKPDLMPLTGGYRRTPVMQIGADIFCDTAIILRELEARFPIPTLKLPGHEGLAQMVAGWTDGRWFQASVAVIFGEMGDKVPAEFIKDREQMSGQPFNIEAMQAAAPMMRDQWRARLMLLEERLQGGKGAGAGLYLIGTKPGLVDVHAFMNVWWMHQSLPDFLAKCFESADLTKAWFERLREFEGQEPDTITSQEALRVARAAAPRLVAATTRNESQQFAPGEMVAVAPDDYGRVWVEGELVHADSQRVILQRISDEAETLHAHFPRAGYLVRRL